MSTAVLERLPVLETPPVVAVLPVEDSGRTTCPKPAEGGCGHARNQHSIVGCTWPGCGCTITYMQL